MYLYYTRVIFGMQVIMGEEMDLLKYKQILKNTIELDCPNYLKQKLVNDIKVNRIGKYGTKEKDGVVLLTGMSNHTERISTCIDKNNLTIKLFDLLEIKKGYRYTIIFKHRGIDFKDLRESIANIAIDLNSDYYNEYNGNVDDDEVHYYEDTRNFFIKFHKYIDVIDKKKVQMRYLRYPIVFVFHKDMNLFEVRFDRLAIDNDYRFYHDTMIARVSQLNSIYDKIGYEYLDLESTIREIVNEHKDCVEEVIWSFETAKSKGLTLRVGEDGVMPFLGDLELLVNELRRKYDEDNNVDECLKEIENYMNKTKKFANEKFRILSWLKYNENGQNIKLDKSIDIKINFNYNNKKYALLNIFDNEINDMERINHVIRFIGKVAGNIQEL